MTKKLYVFGIGFMGGDPEMGQFLDKSYQKLEELKLELAKFRAHLEDKPYKKVVDTDTQLVVEMHGVLNPQNENAGNVELVWAEPGEYKILVESTGREVGHPHQLDEGTISFFGNNYLERKGH